MPQEGGETPPKIHRRHFCNSKATDFQVTPPLPNSFTWQEGRSDQIQHPIRRQDDQPQHCRLHKSQNTSAIELIDQICAEEAALRAQFFVLHRW